MFILYQIPRGSTMLSIEWPGEYYNSYEEPSETMEVNIDPASPLYHSATNKPLSALITLRCLSPTNPVAFASQCFNFFRLQFCRLASRWNTRLGPRERPAVFSGISALVPSPSPALTHGSAGRRAVRPTLR